MLIFSFFSLCSLVHLTRDILTIRYPLQSQIDLINRTRLGTHSDNFASWLLTSVIDPFSLQEITSFFDLFDHTLSILLVFPSGL